MLNNYMGIAMPGFVGATSDVPVSIGRSLPEYVEDSTPARAFYVPDSPIPDKGLATESSQSFRALNPERIFDSNLKP